ncbi:MAG: sigma-70 family RNA polymerase sigma factor, partial [Oscillospiraceae bacterium]|nr:sigma-70 family RNA polymerase sigma factor [Oscillospiraceae bacterium]
IPELARLAAGGDNAAFERFYELTKSGVWFTCKSLLKNEENARDIMQDTYLAAFEKLASLSDFSGVQGWLNKIAANKCKNFIKSKANSALVEDSEEILENIPDDSLIPEEYVTDIAKRRIIMEIIEKALSEEQFRTIILYYFDEMTAAEIAELMDVHEKTVLYRLKVARAKIKEAIMRYEEENKDKLHGVVFIPTLTRLFKLEAENTPVPNLTLDFMIPPNTQNLVPSDQAAAAAKTGGKAMLNTLKAKIIAGACAAAVVVGGGVTAGVVIANNSKNPQIPVTSQPSFAASSGTAGGNSLPSSGGAASLPQYSQHTDTPEPAPGLWEYMHISDGITISKYNGNEEYIVVPSELDGNKVLAVEDPVHGSEFDYVFSQFGRTNNAKEIVLPEGIERIGYAAFGYLENLETIHIPDSVTSIGYGAFTDCISLDNVIIPEGETDFEFVFDNCKSLKNVKLPESTEKMWNTFYGCESLESVIIPANVKEFEIVFERCTSLNDVTFAGNNIKVIGTGSFITCTSLESIVLPNGVEEISYNAFNGCTSLKNITLPATLTEIKSGAFEDCTSLTDITLPDKVTKLAITAFNGCTNVKVTYKGNVYDYEHLDELFDLFVADE